MDKKSYYEYQERTGFLESSGRYKITKGGFLGKYQMGVLALIDAGYYKGNKNGDLDNRWDGEWTGKDGIHSVEDYLNSPKAQDNAFRAFTKKNWIYIKHYGFDKYFGKEINGITMTLAGMHILGVGGMQEYLKSNGKKIPKDGNGTPIESRIKEFQDNYDVSEITGVPHRDYAQENRLKKYENIKPKYTPEDITKMSNFEFFLKEKEIYKDIKEFRKKAKQMKENNKQKNENLSENKISNTLNNNSTKYINFDDISKNGIPWINWSEKGQGDFLEGLLGKSLDSIDKQRNWTDKFNIGNPHTDKGRWITLENGKHLFIKDKNSA